MKARIGQWVRIENIFYDIKEILPQGYFKLKHNKCCDGKEHKVADTPQELIEDNDIGFIEEWQSIETLYISDDGVYCYMDSKRHFIGKDITIIKILTPNEDKSVYTLQWEQTT